MKKLTIEQKAQAYDEAFERAKEEWSNNLDSAYKNYREHLEIIFPELKESEDEKIRKAIIDYFRWNTDSQLLNEFTNREVFDWLEKQGKQNPTKQPHSHKLEEEIEEWLGREAFPEGTNITPLPKAMEIVRRTANHFYDFGSKH